MREKKPAPGGAGSEAERSEAKDRAEVPSGRAGRKAMGLSSPRGGDRLTQTDLADANWSRGWRHGTVSSVRSIRSVPSIRDFRGIRHTGALAPPRRPQLSFGREGFPQVQILENRSASAKPLRETPPCDHLWPIMRATRCNIMRQTWPGYGPKEQGMIVGVLKEIKAEENRVSMTPAGVEVMRRHGHRVLVEKGAGVGSGLEDEAYLRAGAEIMEAPEQIFGSAEMVMHVKEPLPSEYDLIREGQIVFTYLHLAAAEDLTCSLIRTGCVAIAYETIRKEDGSLPLLTPMSEVAGRMAIQQGAKYLEMAKGGHGVLLGGVPGVDPGTVLVIGGGVVGTNAAKMACGLGAKVYVLDTDLDRLRYLSDIMPKNCFLLMSSPAAIRELITRADVVVGAVLIPGARAPKVVTRDMLKTMKKGAVLVDVAIDQGGCFETSRPTTHADPIYSVDGIVHYCVTNMPGAVPKTSTIALTNATLPYALEIADKGWRRAMQENPAIREGANIIEGKVTHQAVAEAFGLDWVSVEELLAT